MFPSRHFGRRHFPTRHFGKVGAVVTPVPVVDAPESYRRIIIQAVDYNQIADRFLVARAYDQLTCGEIVRDLIATYLAADGFVEGDVQDGQFIEHVPFNYKSVAECFNELAEISGFSWNIDYYKHVHFFERITYPSPFAISAAVAKFRRISRRNSLDQFRNVQYLRAGNEITNVQTEEFAGDGKRRTWTVAFPVAETPLIRVNGASKTVGVRGVDTGRQYYWSKGSNEISQDTSQTVLTTSDELQVEFKGLFPIIQILESGAAISERQVAEGGTGRYEALEQAEDLDGSEIVFAKAQAMLNKYSALDTWVEFETDEDRLVAGHLVPVDVPAEGLNGNFLVTSVDMSSITPDHRRYRVSATTGQQRGDFTEFFRKLATGGRRHVIRENELIMRPLVQQDILTFQDSAVASPAAWDCAEVGNFFSVGFSEVC